MLTERDSAEEIVETCTSNCFRSTVKFGCNTLGLNGCIHYFTHDIPKALYTPDPPKSFTIKCIANTFIRLL